MRVTAVCGLIDWDKTWRFATNSVCAKETIAVLHQIILEAAVQRKHHAKDLGFEVRYSGHHSVGHREQRYTNALNRLQRLTFLRADSVEKEKLWMTSILPQAFYGAEVVPPSQTVIKKFRSKAADAIFGVSQSVSPKHCPAVWEPGMFLTHSIS